MSPEQGARVQARGMEECLAEAPPGEAGIGQELLIQPIDGPPLSELTDALAECRVAHAKELAELCAVEACREENGHGTE